MALGVYFIIGTLVLSLGNETMNFKTSDYLMLIHYCFSSNTFMMEDAAIKNHLSQFMSIFIDVPVMEKMVSYIGYFKTLKLLLLNIEKAKRLNKGQHRKRLMQSGKKSQITCCECMNEWISGFL